MSQHLVDVLRGGSAHVPFDRAIAGWKRPALRGVRPEGAAHTAWHLPEQLGIAQ